VAELTAQEEAYDVIARLAGAERARELWEGFNARWRDGRGWKRR